MSGYSVPPLVSTLLLILVWASFIVVVWRNAFVIGQLAVATWVFAHRVRPARRTIDLWSRYRDLAPPVSIIAPAYNEELSVVDAVRALLTLNYPNHEVIVVNDGSSDATLDVLREAFELQPSKRQQIAALQTTEILGVYASAAYPKLLVIDKENGRKADAANAGIGFAITPLVCVIDADSIIAPDGLLRAIEPFMSDEGDMMGVGGSIRIINGNAVRGGHVESMALSDKWLPRFQIIEYMRAFLSGRVASAHFNALMLVSGAFGIFKRSIVVEIGGYRHDTLGEDLELVTHIHRHMREQNRPCRIEFLPEIVCWTEAPETLAGLRNQRSRWEQGALETLSRHKKMLFNPRYGRIGMIGMPMILIEDLIGPPLELIGYIAVPLAWYFGLVTPVTLLTFFSLTILMGIATSVGGLVLEEQQQNRIPKASNLLRLTLVAVVENFGYHQLNLIFRVYGMWRHWRKDTSWAGVPRVGFTRAEDA